MKMKFKESCRMPVLLVALSLMLGGRVPAQTFTTLQSFTVPYSTSGEGIGLSGLILGANKLYGAIQAGFSPSPVWTVFALNTDGTAFTNLYSLSSGDGWGLSGLVFSGNTLFGTAVQGGKHDYGTVFALSGDGADFRKLHDFTFTEGLANSDGAYPRGGVILSGNTLYGTAADGGSAGNGGVFRLNTDGTGYTNLHSFRAFSGYVGIYTNSEGAFPLGALILTNDTLYGTTYRGGRSGNGTVFAVNTDGTGFTTLHTFTGTNNYPGPFANSDGANPQGGLLLSSNTLYGTTPYGGRSGNGTVFALHTDGTGFTTLHSFLTNDPYFPNSNSDGVYPNGNLVLANNILYGTTYRGGRSGSGTVFALSTDGTDFTILHHFTATIRAFLNSYISYTNSDGALPTGALVLLGNTLYGMAAAGGKSGAGTMFSLSVNISPPSVVCSTPLILECTNGTAAGIIQSEVQDTNGYPLQVVWTVDGTPSQTNSIPSGGTNIASNVTFTANFELGEHVVVASASNGRTDPVTCSTTVTVHDTTPPQVISLQTTPNVLWPPNHRMIPVNLVVEAVDNCDPSPAVKIISVTSNEPQNRVAPDWEITGAQSLNLRAERLGTAQARIYTIVVQCLDLSGNVSTAAVDVAVAHN